MNFKDTNPKDAAGIKKAPASVVPAQVELEVGLALLEGARKYGRHNYRVSGVRASVYYDAARRHLAQWWEGEDIDPDSELSHVTKAIASLVVLRDSMMTGNWNDDRPPALTPGWMQAHNERAARILAKYPEAAQPYTELEVGGDEEAPMTDSEPDLVPLEYREPPKESESAQWRKYLGGDFWAWHTGFQLWLADMSDPGAPRYWRDGAAPLKSQLVERTMWQAANSQFLEREKRS